jgi:hypothetical protein
MTSSRSQKERRKHPRFAVEDASAMLTPEGTLVLLGMGLGNKALGAVDLSEGGARLRTREPLDPGAKVRVTLEFEKPRKKIEARGEVRWSRKAAETRREVHSGVMFLDLPPAQARKIKGMRAGSTPPHGKRRKGK